jgi:predicted nucleic acid-binding protein
VTVYYLETSALLKRYRTEKGTDLLDALFESKQESEIFTTSYFTSLEVTSVATRLFKAETITKRSYHQLLGRLSQDMRRLVILQPVSDFILSEALNLIMDHALRAPDAIQLATALMVKSTIVGQPLYFLCADAKLRGACVNSELTILDPEAPDSVKILKSYRNIP